MEREHKTDTCSYSSCFINSVARPSQKYYLSISVYGAIRLDNGLAFLVTGSLYPAYHYILHAHQYYSLCEILTTQVLRTRE